MRAQGTGRPKSGVRLLFVLMGCAAVSLFMIRASIGSASSADNEKQALQWLSGVQLYEPQTPSLKEMVKGSDLAARVQVESIEFPVWNSKHGSQWDGEEGVSPLVFSVVDIKVLETYGPQGAPDSLALWIYGDARQRWESSEEPPAAASSGGLQEGGEFILLLSDEPIPFEGGPQAVWTTSYGYHANFRIDGDTAIPADSGRPQQLEALEAELRSYGA